MQRISAQARCDSQTGTLTHVVDINESGAVVDGNSRFASPSGLGDQSEGSEEPEEVEEEDEDDEEDEEIEDKKEEEDRDDEDDKEDSDGDL